MGPRGARQRTECVHCCITRAMEYGLTRMRSSACNAFASLALKRIGCQRNHAMCNRVANACAVAPAALPVSAVLQVPESMTPLSRSRVASGRQDTALECCIASRASELPRNVVRNADDAVIGRL